MTPAANAKPGDAERDFIEVKTKVNALLGDAKRKQFRHNYKSLNAKLVLLSVKHAKTDRGDDFLFVAAKLKEELSLASRIASDIDDAVKAFNEVAARFPKGNLADDALYEAAKLRFERQGDSEAARVLLKRVIAMKADMASSAKTLMRRLPAEKTRSAKAGEKVNAIDKSLAAIEKEASKAVVSPAQKTVEVLPSAPPPGTKTQRLKPLIHEIEDGESVVTIALSGMVGVTRGEALPSETRGRRIFFDLTPAKLKNATSEPLIVNDDVIAQVRAGQYAKNTVRIVIDLKGDEEPVLLLEKDPFVLRFVSEFEATPKVASPPIKTLDATLSKALASVRDETMPSSKSATLKKPKLVAPKSAGHSKAMAKNGRVQAIVTEGPLVPTLDPQKTNKASIKERIGTDGTPGGVSISQQMGLAVRRVVIDAGHGGSDTGAIGPSGVKEKDITLAIARKVRDRLQQQLPDVEIVMTRDEDKTMQLSDRTDIANGSRADLFISIHANAHPSRKVRGVETYYLNITHDRYAMRLANRENSALEDAGKKQEKSISDLQFILADLAMKSNVDDSIRLGRQVQRSVVNELKQNYKSVHDLGLKHALFYVLMGARMPAILVETSFLSNRVEEKRLKDKKYQKRVADGIVRGVKSFLAERHAFQTAKSPR